MKVWSSSSRTQVPMHLQASLTVVDLYLWIMTEICLWTKWIFNWCPRRCWWNAWTQNHSLSSIWFGRISKSVQRTNYWDDTALGLQTFWYLCLMTTERLRGRNMRVIKNNLSPWKMSPRTPAKEYELLCSWREKWRRLKAENVLIQLLNKWHQRADMAFRIQQSFWTLAPPFGH